MLSQYPKNLMDIYKTFAQTVPMRRFFLSSPVVGEAGNAAENFKKTRRYSLFTRAHGLAWLERPADNREVSRSNRGGPTIPAFFRFLACYDAYFAVAVDTCLESLF